MEKIPQQNEKSVALEFIKTQSEHAREEVELLMAENREMTWPDAAINFLESIHEKLEDAIEAGFLDETKAFSAREKANALLADLRGIKSRYSQLEDEVPEDDKEKIISKFKILK